MQEQQELATAHEPTPSCSGPQLQQPAGNHFTAALSGLAHHVNAHHNAPLHMLSATTPARRCLLSRLRALHRPAVLCLQKISMRSASLPYGNDAHHNCSRRCTLPYTTEPSLIHGWVKAKSYNGQASITNASAATRPSCPRPSIYATSRASGVVSCSPHHYSYRQDQIVQKRHRPCSSTIT